MPKLKDIPALVKRPGWTVVGYDEFGETLRPVEETVLAPDLLNPLQQKPTKTGKSYVTIADEEGNTDKVYVSNRNPDDPDPTHFGAYDAEGKPSWFVTEGPGPLPAGGPTKTPDERKAALDKVVAETAQAQAATAASQASTTASAATAAHTTESTRELAGQNAQRDANQARGLGWLLDTEVQKTQQDATKLGLDAEGLKIRREELGQQAHNQAVNNQIAAGNLAIAAQNQSLNELKQALAEKIALKQIDGDEAKLEYSKAKDEADRQIAASRLDLERLNNQQSNQVAQQNVDINRQTLEQRKAEAAQTQANNALQAQTAAQTAATGQQNAATTAASTILQNQAQGGQAGASLLNQRVAAAQGMLGQVLGLTQGHKLLAGVPEGLGDQLVSGIQDWTAQLGGGQGVYDAAARMVTAADPQNGHSPEAQVAYGALTQMLERYKQQTGQDHPAVIATQAAQQSTAANGLAAPQTLAPAGQTMPWNNGLPSATGAPMIAGATPFMNAGTTYYGNGGLQPDQGVFVAPAPSPQLAALTVKA